MKPAVEIYPSFKLKQHSLYTNHSFLKVAIGITLSFLASGMGERDCLECGAGDRMGCGIVFNPLSKLNHRIPQLVLIYFTKNGSIVYRKVRRLPEGGFYPTVGLQAKGINV